MARPNPSRKPGPSPRPARPVRPPQRRPDRPRRGPPRRPRRPSRPGPLAPRPRPRTPTPVLPRPLPRPMVPRPGPVVMPRPRFRWRPRIPSPFFDAWDLADMLANAGAPGAPDGNYNFGGLIQICSSPDNPVYEKKYRWGFNNVYDPTANCGLSNQAFFGARAPNPSTQTAYKFQGPRLNGLDRYELVEKRAAAAPGVRPIIYRSYDATGLVRPNTTHPDTSPIAVPGTEPGLVAPTPRSPIRSPGSSPWPQGRIVFNGEPIAPPIGQPSTQVSQSPNAPPVVRPNPHPWPRRPEPYERERKGRLQAAGAAILAGLGFASEVADLIEVAYNALPREVRRKYRLAKWRPGGYVTPRDVDMANVVWREWRHLDLNEFVKGWIANELEDRVAGRIHAQRQKARRHFGFTVDPLPGGTPSGATAANWKL